MDPWRNIAGPAVTAMPCSGEVVVETVRSGRAMTYTDLAEVLRLEVFDGRSVRIHAGGLVVEGACHPDLLPSSSTT